MATIDMLLHEKLTHIFGSFEEMQCYVIFRKINDPFIPQLKITGCERCIKSPSPVVPAVDRRQSFVTSSSSSCDSQNVGVAKEISKNDCLNFHNQQQQQLRQNLPLIGIDIENKLPECRFKNQCTPTTISNATVKESKRSKEESKDKCNDPQPSNLKRAETIKTKEAVDKTSVKKIGLKKRTSKNPSIKSIIKRFKAITESSALITPLKHDVKRDLKIDEKIAQVTTCLNSHLQKVADEQVVLKIENNSMIITETCAAAAVATDMSENLNILQQQSSKTTTTTTTTTKNDRANNKRRRPSIIRKPGKLLKVEALDNASKNSQSFLVVEKENSALLDNFADDDIFFVENYEDQRIVKSIENPLKNFEPIFIQNDQIRVQSSDPQVPQMEFVNGEPSLMCRIPLDMLKSKPKRKVESVEHHLLGTVQPQDSGTQKTTIGEHGDLFFANDDAAAVDSTTKDQILNECLDMPVIDFNALESIDFSSFFNNSLSLPPSPQEITQPHAVTTPSSLPLKSVEPPENLKSNASKRKISVSDKEKESQTKRQKKIEETNILMSLAPKQPYSFDKKIFPDDTVATQPNYVLHSAIDKNIFVEIVMCCKVAALYFLSGNVLESKQGPFNIYQKAFLKLNLVSKRIPILFREINSDSNRNKRNVLEKLTIVTDILRSLLYYRLYLSKTKFVYRNFDLIRQYHKSTTVNSVVNTLFNDEGVDVASVASTASSSSSPSNSPAAIHGSSSPVPDGFVAIPNKLEVLYKQQIEYFRGLCLAHHHWQSVEKQKGCNDNKEFLSHLDRLCGKMSISMNPRQSCIYLLTALQWIENLYEAYGESVVATL